MNVAQFKELPLMGILRGVAPDILDELIESIVSSGLKTIEITMNTQGASELIERATRLARERLVIGAGTVLTVDDLQCALDHGASFIVLPTLVEEVVRHCTKHNIPVFPGALTPQEIHNAWSAGATMVKVFPAKFFGPSYLKEIKGPFHNIELLACGGVNARSIVEFFRAGASGVAFGASIFKKEWLDNKQFVPLAESIKALIAGYRSKTTLN